MILKYLLMLFFVYINIFSNLLYADKYFISPQGDDFNIGIIQAPWKTFRYAFSKMKAGDALVLLDGHYSNITGTGGMHWDYKNFPHSGQIPSGKNQLLPTKIKAKNFGKAFVDIPLFIGRKKHKDSFIDIQGITFNGGQLYNSSYVYIHDSGFSNGFTVGTSDHNEGNTYNLIEDVWIWASQKRIIAINYRAHYNVWRRVLVRGDGCSLDKCSGSGNPNVGFTIYDSHDVSSQNVIVIDRVLNGGKKYADFATAQHTPDQQYFLGRNEWLGIMSVNSEDNAVVFEADNIIKGIYTWRIENALIIDSTQGGINIGNLPYNGATQNIIKNNTIILSPSSKLDGIRLSPGQNISLLNNNIVVNAGRYAINSPSKFYNVITYKPKVGHYNQSSCQSGCFKFNPFKKILNVKNKNSIIGWKKNSKIKRSIARNIGASIVFSYGEDGSRYGDEKFNVLTEKKLWPWPNERRILNEMCASYKSKMCLLGSGSPKMLSITNYINNYLYNNDLF